MRRRLVAGLVLLTAAVAAVYYFRRATGPSPIDATDPPPVAFRQAWAFDPPAPATGPATLDAMKAGGHVYLTVTHPRPGGPPRGAVYALDRQTGQHKWTFDADGTMLPTDAPPWGVTTLLVGEGTAPGRGGRAFGLLDRTGAKRWEHRTADRVAAGPVPSGMFEHARAVVPAGDDGLYALDERTGAVTWHAAGIGHVCTTPSGDSERLYLGTGASEKFPRSEAVAVRAETGEVAWRTPLPLPAAGEVFAVSAIVLVPLAAADGSAGGLAALDPKVGELRWVFRTGGRTHLDQGLHQLHYPGGVTASRALIGAGDGLVHLVDVDAGRAVWSARVGGPVVSAPRSAGDRVFAVTAGGRVVILNHETGTPVGRFDVDVLAGGPVAVLAARAGPRTVLAAGVATPAGPAVRVYCLEYEEWFRR